MKKILFALVFVMAFASLATAQPVKGSFTKAQAFLAKGEVAEAKKYIDAAMEDPKQNTKGKAWMVKGQVYQAIALSDDEAIQALAPNALDEALAAYAKVKEIEKPGSAIMKELEETQGVDPNTFAIRPSVMEEFKGVVFQKGVAQYNEQDYKGAMTSFENCYKITPGDTLAALYAMTCAELEEDEAGIERNAKALIAMNYTDAKLYISLARKAYRSENWQKVLDWANEGRAKNPQDTELIKFMTDAYIRMGKKAEAISALQESLKNDPKDKMAWFSLGTLYSEDKAYDKAEDAFRKSLEADPNFSPTYTNFFLLFNDQIRIKGDELNGLLDNKGGFKDPARAQAINNEINELRKKCLPILEKAHSLEPNEVSILESAIFIYRKLNMDNEALAYCEKQLAIDPLNRALLENLAYLYTKANQGAKFDALLKKTMAQGEERHNTEPTNVAVAEALAYIYEELGMKDKAKAMNAKLDAME